MIDYEQYCRIRQLKEKGLRPAQISREVDLDARTIRKWMNRNAFQQRLPCLRPSKLDPYNTDFRVAFNRHNDITFSENLSRKSTVVELRLVRIIFGVNYSMALHEG